MSTERFDRFQPPADLRGSIAEIDLQVSSQPVHQSVLPELGLVLGFQFEGRLSVVDAAGQEQVLDSQGITGLHDHPKTFRSAGALGSVLVRFEPWASRHLLGIPATEVAGLSLGLDSLVGRDALAPFTDEWSQAATDAARMRSVAGLLRRIVKPIGNDPLTRRAVSLILQRRGLVRIADLLDELGTSHSPLVRRFQDQVGVGPKAFASLVRFRELLPVLSSWEGTIADLAVQMGYHDQAHFIHEFRKLTGFSPRQYLGRDRWTESLIHLD